VKEVLKVRMKSLVYIFFILSFCVLLTGCGSKNSDTAATGETTSKISDSDSKNDDISITEEATSEVTVCTDDKMCFMLNDKKVIVDDELHSANAIVSTVWIDDENLGVTCHVNPSLEYFTVYNKQQENFVFAAYGVGFLWKDNNIESIIYIETPAHFAVDDDSYRIVDYNEEILFSSDNEISDLVYDDDEIVFKITKKDGSMSEKRVQCGK